MLAIELHGLEKQYPGSPDKALGGVDLTVESGLFMGILGPNGAGKTTLLAILCGLRASTAGTIRVLGQDARRPGHTVLSRMGLVPQDIALYPDLTARENLLFFARVQGLAGRELRERVETSLAQVGLAEHADRRIRTFSGGMKRRANLAVGIVHRPEILILDEPTVGVDAQSRALIFELLRDLHRGGTTLLYATHYMEEAATLCQRLILLDHGTILLDGSPDALLRDHPDCANLEQLFLRATGRGLRDDA